MTILDTPPIEDAYQEYVKQRRESIKDDVLWADMRLAVEDMASISALIRECFKEVKPGTLPLEQVRRWDRILRSLDQSVEKAYKDAQ